MRQDKIGKHQINLIVNERSVDYITFNMIRMKIDDDSTIAWAHHKSTFLQIYLF